MRLRRIAEAKEIVGGSELCMKEPLDMQGRWQELATGKPIWLEIGMGRGAFIIGHALAEPQKFFLGLEFREEMLLLAEKRLQKEMALRGLFGYPENLRLLWCNALVLTELFAENEVDNIYLNFSDPWPKARHAKRRLTHRNFYEQYAKIIKPGGKIYLRTDGEEFFDWSLESFAESPFECLSVCRDTPMPQDNIISEYEKRYREQGQPIFTAVFERR